MTTIVNYLVVLTVAALLAGPALYGAARERRIGRQLHEAAAGRSREKVRRTQKSSSRSTVPSTATW
ncbi:hypothetical protein ACIGFK_05005 [Streptomyces sp. NPDC085524]|uniref:hypothetical protein n=1 Tax=unclassified Streptomyces TaxID=2593676 RepID=UPI0035D74498